MVLRDDYPSGAPRTVIAVPRDALILRAGTAYIFTINGENEAERINVELGTADGDLIEVRGDVVAGDRVVIRGGERLRPGQMVEVSELREATQRVG